MKFIDWMDKQTKLLKVVFCIPVVSIIWVVYRLVLSAIHKDWLGLVICILLIFVGIPWLWLLDLLFILVEEKILWFKYEPKVVEATPTNEQDEELNKQELQEIEKLSEEVVENNDFTDKNDK